MPDSATAVVVVPGTHLMPTLLGPRDEYVRQIERTFPNTNIHVRGNEVSINGAEVGKVAGLFEELVALLQRGAPLDAVVVQRAIDMVNSDQRPSAVLTLSLIHI